MFFVSCSSFFGAFSLLNLTPPDDNDDVLASNADVGTGTL